MERVSSLDEIENQGISTLELLGGFSNYPSLIGLHSSDLIGRDSNFEILDRIGPSL